jgi:hypothetical protein
MQLKGREIKWAVGGFLGGFSLCYVILGAFGHQPGASPLLAKVTPVTALPAIPAVAATTVTNLPLPAFRIELPPRWVGTSPEPPGPGYSLDLIDDTHNQ